MKRSLFSLLVLGTIVGLTHFNCATRWREANTGRTADEIAEMLTKVQSSSRGSSASLDEAIQVLKDNPNDSIVYFSEAPGALGPIEAVTPIDFSFVNSQIGFSEVSSIRVFFIDLLTDGGHLNYMIVDYTLGGSGGTQYEVFSNKSVGALGSIKDNEFVSILKGDNGKNIVVRSFDVADDDLQDTVQLELSSADENFAETDQNLGQVSSLEGFSVNF